MLTLPNFITLLRFPLAIAFFQENPIYRTLALLLAMLSDALDGYLARTYAAKSRVGTFLDPLADKFFVIIALSALLNEKKLLPWEACTMLCRDFSVILFGIYLWLRGHLKEYQFRAIICGKLMTALQFAVLLGLILGVSFPPLVFFLFIIIGFSALIELYIDRSKLKVEH